LKSIVVDDGERQLRSSVFVIQFLCALAEEGLLTFDHDAACWRWDLDRLHAKGHTDNVADLMVGKLTPPKRRRRCSSPHGGRLWATAKAPRGAIFQFTLHQDDAV
jgi:hypothetical protein